MDIIQQITQTVGQNVQYAYQARFSMISSAAALAAVPNWKQVLDEEFDGYVAAMKKQATENKDKLANQVPPEKLLQARSAVSDAVDAAIEESRKHCLSMVAMVERLTAVQPNLDTQEV